MAKKTLVTDFVGRGAEITPAVDPEKIDEVKRDLTKSPNFFSIYSNDIDVQTAPWDIRFIFNQITDYPTRTKPILGVTQLGEVRISPQVGKRLVSIILEQLQAYEQRFGEIPTAKEADSQGK